MELSISYVSVLSFHSLRFSCHSLSPTCIPFNCLTMSSYIPNAARILAVTIIPATVTIIFAYAKVLLQIRVHRDCSYVSIALRYVILREFVRFRTGRPCRFHVLAIFQQYFVFRTKLCLPPLCTHQQLCKQIDLLLAIFVKIWSLCDLFGADGIN
jgi:hypothetical protein